MAVCWHPAVIAHAIPDGTPGGPGHGRPPAERCAAATARERQQSAGWRRQACRVLERDGEMGGETKHAVAHVRSAVTPLFLKESDIVQESTYTVYLCNGHGQGI